jgi:hypothetical protein
LSDQIRNIVIGRHSRVWQSLAARLADAAFTAIGHREVDGFAFTSDDRVWIFSFGRAADENAALLRRVAQAGVEQIIYVSSSSTIVADVTSCYEYPRIKHLAELEALQFPMGKVLTLGLVYEHVDELPGGLNAATSHAELARFMMAPEWPEQGGRGKRLFGPVERSFRNGFDRWAFAQYGQLMRLAGRFPCLLRPADVALRALGARWYGYTYLSNRLWSSKLWT